mmetsp:Transcript_27742/g.65870  ORF Transcript_27742/g.65870 Transcript_27742/m.65870 type:complete len:303 (+) Transcript_27742:2248-3156(+)
MKRARPKGNLSPALGGVFGAGLAAEGSAITAWISPASAACSSGTTSSMTPPPKWTVTARSISGLERGETSTGAVADLFRVASVTEANLESDASSSTGCSSTSSTGSSLGSCLALQHRRKRWGHCHIHASRKSAGSKATRVMGTSAASRHQTRKHASLEAVCSSKLTERFRKQAPVKFAWTMLPPVATILHGTSAAHSQSMHQWWVLSGPQAWSRYSGQLSKLGSLATSVAWHVGPSNLAKFPEAARSKGHMPFSRICTAQRKFTGDPWPRIASPGIDWPISARSKSRRSRDPRLAMTSRITS